MRLRGGPAFKTGICMFTSKQYLAKAFEYGSLAKTLSGSNQKGDFQELEQRFFQELEQKFTVLAVLADIEQLLADEKHISINSRRKIAASALLVRSDQFE